MNTSSSKCLTLGRLIPKILLLVFVVDCAWRLLPIDGLTFRAWEAMVRFHAPCAPFKADAVYDNPKSFGDLAAMGNLPPYRQYHREVFTTDHYGFRRNASAAGPKRNYRVLLLGDSMAVGSSVNDSATLSSQLEQELGQGVYNGASPGGTLVHPGEILQVAERIGMRRGTVILQYLGRGELPGVAEVKASASSGCDPWANRFVGVYDDYVRFSPLQIAAQQFFKRLQDDITLPNLFHEKVVERRLQNGAPMLFFPEDVSRYRRRPPGNVAGVKLLADILAAHGLELVVVLVPDKYTVYEPLLRDADRIQRNGPLFLDGLEQQLTSVRIPVVNLTEFLRDKAREAYEKRQYLYWLDDTHWNARGIELAAHEVVARHVIH